MTMPLISPILLVIFLILLFILLYLYKTSEIMNKRKLSYSMIMILVIFIVINFLHYRKNTPPEQKFRLAVIIDDANSSHQPWQIHAVSEIVAKQLYRTVKDQAIITPIYQLIHIDSLKNDSYLKKISDRIKASHYFFCFLTQKDTTLVLNYHLQPNDHDGISDTISFSEKELLSTTEQMTRKILNYFKIPAQNQIQPQYTKSKQALKYYIDGHRFLLDENYPLAIENLTKAISADSAFAEAYTLIAQCLLALGVKQWTLNKSAEIQEFHQVKYFINKAIELDSTNDENFRILGEYYIYHERWSQAEIMLKKAFELNSNNPKIYLALSRMHPSRFKKLGFKNEKNLYHRAIFINPCYEKAYLLLSDEYLFQNKRDQAIGILNEFLSINPYSVPVLMALAKIYIVRNDFFKIMEILNRVIELDPDNSDAYFNLGILYYNSKDFENAKRLFERAIELDNHLNAHLYLAYIHELEGNLDKAIDYLRKRIRFKTGPDDEFAEEARKHLFKLVHADSTQI